MPQIMIVDDDAKTQLELAGVHKRLEESEERFRTIYEQSPIGIEIYNAHGRLAHVNEACLNIFGISDFSEVMGFNLMKDPNIPNESKNRLQQGENVRNEVVFDFDKVKEQGLYKTTKSGVVHLDVRITPLGLPAGKPLSGYLVQVMEINDHKRAMVERDQTLSQLRATLDATVDGIIVVGLDSRIKVFSKRFKKILKMPDSILDSKDGVQALNYLLDQLNEPAVFSRKVQEALADPDSNTLDKLYLKDGRILEVYSRPQKLDGKMSGRVWGFRDVTKQKRLEMELIQSRKMEAIGTLTGGIAHDYNNLLSIIMGNLSLAMEEVKPGSLLAEFLQEASMASHKVRDLTHELMALSRGGTPAKKVGSLKGLLKTVTDLLPTDGSISLKESICRDLWPFPHDPFKMGAVFRNVTINSLEAMPHGGTLEIEAENLTVADGDTSVHLPLNPGDYVHISFHDGGVGIPEEHLEKLFDPYFSTKTMGVQKGMGLGLATAYAIVQKHGGHTVIRSKPGEGTTVSIYLPAEREALNDPGAMDGKAIPQPRKRVLLMDDEEMLRKLGEQMLKRMGYDVETVKDGLEARAALENQKNSGKPFDAVILDLTIKGGMGGDQTLRELLKIDPHVKAILSSGYFNDPAMSHFEKYGFKGAMAKPYEMKNLKEALEKLLDGEKT